MRNQEHQGSRTYMYVFVPDAQENRNEAANWLRQNVGVIRVRVAQQLLFRAWKAKKAEGGAFGVGVGVGEEVLGKSNQETNKTARGGGGRGGGWRLSGVNGDLWRACGPW